METSFYNTVHATHPELGQFEKKAKSQEEKILKLFKEWTIGRMGIQPSDVLAMVFDNTVPLTSIRRAMTNLTNRGDLIKTNIQMRGPYGHPEYLWRLADKYSQQELFV